MVPTIEDEAFHDETNFSRKQGTAVLDRGGANILDE